jgi:HAMP domain-containing protein
MTGDERDEEMPPAVVPGAAWRGPGIRTLAALAVAAAILAAVAVPVIRALRSMGAAPEERQRLIAMTPITLSPPRRGEQGPASLPGRGPWSIEVLLPFGAAGGVYEVTILEEGGASVPFLAARAEAGHDARLRVMVPSLPRHGRYMLRLLPPGSGADAYLYPFVWQGDPVAPAGEDPR